MKFHARTSARFCLSLCVVALLTIGVFPLAMAAGQTRLSQFVPSDSKGVVVLDIAALRRAGALKAFMASTGASKKLNSVDDKLGSVGFKPMKQVNRILLSVPSFNRQTRPVMIFEGNFPQSKIEAALNQEGAAKREMIGKIAVYTRSKRGSLAFLTPTIAVIGPSDGVKKVARIAAGTAHSKPGSALRYGIAHAKKSKNVWFAVDLPSKYLEDTPFKGAKSVYGEANVAADLALSISARMPSTQAASDAVKTGKQTLETMANRDEITALGLAPVVRSIKASNSGSIAHTSLHLDQSRFRRLLVTVSTIIEDQLR